jgi:hypothetical protein
MKSELVLDLPHGKNNPRNSEGAFVSLKNGQILYAYTRFCGLSNWADDASASICGRCEGNISTAGWEQV